MKPEERDALLPCPFCGATAGQPWGGDVVCCGTEGCAGDAGVSPSQWNRRSAQSPAGVPPEPTEANAGWLAQLVIDKLGGTNDLPAWVYRSARYYAEALERAERAERSAGVPTTEPVPPIARELAEIVRDMWADGQTDEERIAVPYAHFERLRALSGVSEYELESPYDTAPQAPVEPVAQEPCADCKSPAACKSVGHCRHGYHARTVAQEPVALVRRDAGAVIGSLLDAWEGLTHDERDEDFLSQIAKHLRELDGLAEDDQLYASPISLPVEVAPLQDENARLHAWVNECEQQRQIEFARGYKAGKADVTRG